MQYCDSFVAVNDSKDSIRSLKIYSIKDFIYYKALDGDVVTSVPVSGMSTLNSAFTMALDGVASVLWCEVGLCHTGHPVQRRCVCRVQGRHAIDWD
eukprot:1175758-Prorocentrum_minimum.AAC.1